jgi:DMSO reductase family type II enzyme chaperone
LIAQHEQTQLRSAVYELLALAFMYPEEGASALLEGGARDLAERVPGVDWPDLSDALDRLIGELGSAGDEAFEREHESVFGHAVSADCAPYEAEYGQAQVFQKSQTLAEVSGFYKSFGVTPNPALHERLDHISVELEFMHLLTLKEARAQMSVDGEGIALICRQAQEAFLAGHLANWIGAFGSRLATKSGDAGVYGALAGLLDAHMSMELGRFQLDPTPADTPPIVPQEDDPGCDDPEPIGATAQEVSLAWER